MRPAAHFAHGSPDCISSLPFRPGGPPDNKPTRRPLDSLVGYREPAGTRKYCPALLPNNRSIPGARPANLTPVCPAHRFRASTSTRKPSTSTGALSGRVDDRLGLRPVEFIRRRPRGPSPQCRLGRPRAAIPTAQSQGSIPGLHGHPWSRAPSGRCNPGCNQNLGLGASLDPENRWGNDAGDS